MKKAIMIILALTLALTILAACGGATTPAPTSTTVAPKPSTTVAPSTTTAPTTIAPTTAAPTTTAPPAAAWKPEKFITWIVPSGPGGGFDLYSRAVANAMGKVIGQEFVVKNVPGAGGVTGMMSLYRR